MIPIDFLILKMVLKSLTQHFDHILTGKDNVAAFVDGARIGHSFELRRIGTASRDVHRQSQFPHPCLHPCESFQRDFLVRLSGRDNIPHGGRQLTAESVCPWVASV